MQLHEFETLRRRRTGADALPLRSPCAKSSSITHCLNVSQHRPAVVDAVARRDRQSPRRASQRDPIDHRVREPSVGFDPGSQRRVAAIGEFHNRPTEYVAIVLNVVTAERSERGSAADHPPPQRFDDDRNRCAAAPAASGRRQSSDDRNPAVSWPDSGSSHFR